MMIADVTATGDDNLITAQSSDLGYRREQLRRLQDEVIDLEDLKTGVSVTDLGLNDFRMDLLGYIKTHGSLELAPKGMHAVVPAQPELGLKPGVIFTLRNRNDSVNINQHNRLHPYYLIYIAIDGQVIANHTEVKKLLDLARTSCKGQSEPVEAVCRLFNRQIDEGRNMKVCSDLLSGLAADEFEHLVQVCHKSDLGERLGHRRRIEVGEAQGLKVDVHVGVKIGRAHV